MKGLPIEYTDLLYYAKTLNFYEKPDYNFIRKKLWAGLLDTNYEDLRQNIIMYDWSDRD